MNHTDIVLRIVEMAKVGEAMQPSDAMAHIAALINKLDMRSDRYDADVAVLLGIRTTNWGLASWPGVAHDPDWVPPMLGT